MQDYKQRIRDHIHTHAIIYLFMSTLLLSGIIFGAILVNSMSFIQKQDLFFYLERFFNFTISEQNEQGPLLWKESFFYHLKYLAFLFLLGLSVVGLPIIWVLLFIKGLVVGFSVGFIVSQLGTEGLLFASLTIAPHNLFIVPIYLVAATFAMTFSLISLKKIFSRRNVGSLQRPFVNYVMIFSISILLSGVASFVESYVSKGAMEALIKSFYL
jgi:stage II sporulation protein M